MEIIKIYVTGAFNLSSNSILRVEGTVVGIEPKTVSTAKFDYPVLHSAPSYPDGLVFNSLVCVCTLPINIPAWRTAHGARHAALVLIRMLH